MATLVALPETRQQRRLASPLASDPAFLALCTVVACLLLGYHPYAEDGGIYASAAALRVDPTLFPAERAFAVAHTGRSLFVPLLAAVVRSTGLSLPAVLLLAHFSGIAATLTAALRLARTCFTGRRAKRWAVALLAATLGLPVAGTSLYLVDPYVTARSLTTPLLLLGLAFLLQRRDGRALACLAASAPLHPLMCLWAALLYGTVLARRMRRPLMSTAALSACALAAMALLTCFGPPETAAGRSAGLSRGYWFIQHWEPYEVVGLLAPAPLLVALARSWRGRVHLTRDGQDLALSAAAAAGIVATGAILLVHASSHSLLLARLQPLRLLHPVYLVLLLLLGGMASTVPVRGRRNAAGWAFCLVGGAALLGMQRELYSSSGQWELPGLAPRNPWAQAFLWARTHTPIEAVFALDAAYTTDTSEDAQMFRAIALRSSLPDAAKDGGISSVMPDLAPAWIEGRRAQAGLNTMTDAERIRHVKPLGATWIVLPATATTSLPCAYQNAAARVCRLP